MALKENYKDDILDVSVNTKRKYRMTENADGTISLEDETVYTQEGDSFGASDMNATNGKVNTLESDIGEINDNLSGFKYYPIGTNLVALVSDDSFYTDSDGKYVLASSTTGQSMIDNVTYKALASTEETHGEVGADTCSPFKGGGAKETASAMMAPDSNSYYVYIYQIINEKDDTIQSYQHGQNTAGQLEGEYVAISKNASPNPTLRFKAKKQGKYRIYKLNQSIGGSQSYTFIEEKTCNANDDILTQPNWGFGGLNYKYPQFIVKAM